MFKNKLVLFSFLCFSPLLFNIAVWAQPGKTIKTIVVDAGHGGHDGGATGQYENSLRSKEKDVTLAISKKLVAELKKQLPSTLGPVTPPISRIKNFYIKTILIKFSRQAKLNDTRSMMLSAIDRFKINPVSKNIILQIDVDPI